MQTVGHNKPHDIGSIVPALAQDARTGHSIMLAMSAQSKARATRPSISI